MNIIDFLRNLFAPGLQATIQNKNGDNANKTKLKIGNNSGSAAGRDIINNYSVPASPKELPYVYMHSGFGGNGVHLRLTNCTTYNLSDQFILLERTEILGRAIPFNGQVLPAGQSLQHSGIDDLEYPNSDEERFAAIFFRTRNGKQFVAKQELRYSARVGDNKFNVIGLSEPVIEQL